MDDTTNTNITLSTENTAQDFNESNRTTESITVERCWESQDLKLLRRKRLRTAQRVAAAAVSYAIARTVHTT